VLNIKYRQINGALSANGKTCIKTGYFFKKASFVDVIDLLTNHQGWYFLGQGFIIIGSVTQYSVYIDKTIFLFSPR